MNIDEMLAKACKAADDMQAFMDEHNESSRKEEKMACAHFGIPYVPYESPFLSREEFHEKTAQSMLLLLLTQEAAQDRVKAYDEEKE